MSKMAKGALMRGHFIGGQWVPGQSSFPDLNPADGSVWAFAAEGGSSEALRAIEAAREAFPAWSALPHTERARALLKAARVWDSRRDDFV
ncbi:MAG: aldehyde dehydrogenase family protein, partial [bacterium]